MVEADDMNLFYVDKDPVAAAQAAGDEFVTGLKICTAQMLSTAHKYFQTDLSVLYEPFDRNHIHARWIRSGRYNYKWAFIYYHTLLKEYNYRFCKPHPAWKEVTQQLIKVPKLPKTSFVDPPVYLPQQFVHKNAVASYRKYHEHLFLGNEFSYDLGRHPPEWLNTGTVH